MKRKITVLLAGVAIVASVFCMGCSDDKKEEKEKTTEVTQQVLIDWDSIIEKLRNAELKDLYVDFDLMEEEIELYDYASFYNVPPAEEKLLEGTYKEGEYELCITYGVIEKERGVFCDEAMYEISLFDYSTKEHYRGVYTVDKEVIYEEGTWFIDDKEESRQIIDKIDELNNIMGIDN